YSHCANNPVAVRPDQLLYAWRMDSPAAVAGHYCIHRQAYCRSTSATRPAASSIGGGIRANSQSADFCALCLVHLCHEIEATWSSNCCRIDPGAGRPSCSCLTDNGPSDIGNVVFIGNLVKPSGIACPSKESAVRGVAQSKWYSVADNIDICGCGGSYVI